MVPSGVFILQAAIQVFLSAYLYLLNSKNKLNISNASLYIASAFLSFVEYEIARTPNDGSIYYWANAHTTIVVTIIYFTVVCSWLFARPFNENPKMEQRLGISILGFLAFFPVLMSFNLSSTQDSLGAHLFLSDSGWKYQVVESSTNWLLNIFNIWVVTAFLVMSICFFIAYKKEKNIEYRRWKKILFLTFSVAPFLVFYNYHLTANESAHKTGSYTVSFYIFLLASVLSRVFSNFKLFEVGPAKALDNILNSMTNLVIITDNGFNITYCNTALQQLFLDKKTQYFEGVNLSKVLRKSSLIKGGMENVDAVIQKIANLAFKDRFERDITLYIDGEEHNYLFIVSPIYHKKQIKTGFSFIGIDLTKVKESEVQLRKYAEQLEKSNRELERFAYIASHDLKTPLRNVISFLSLIKRKTKDADTEMEEYLRFAITNAKNMYNLIEDILEFSRVRNPHKDQWEIVDLNQVVAFVRQNLSSHLKDKKINIETDTLPTIQANAAQMLQLFQNIIENGLKYNKNDLPTVKITWCSPMEGEYVFFIKDNGIGISPEYQEVVFELFKRLHTQSEYPGSGLGLSISKKIAEQYDGDISLESIPNKGSTFKITFKNLNSYFNDAPHQSHSIAPLAKTEQR